MMKSKSKLRDRRDIEEALELLRPLEGEPVVDGVMAALRWVLREAEWREAFGELERKHAGPSAGPDATGSEASSAG